MKRILRAGSKKLGVGVAVAAAVAVSGITAAPAHAYSFTQTLVNRASGKCVEVYYAQTQNYANVDQYTCNGTSTQSWGFQPVSVQHGIQLWEIVNQNSQKCLDVYHGSTANYANVDQYSCNQTDAQLWYYETVPADGVTYMELINWGSGKALDVYDQGLSNFTNVDQYTLNGTFAQQFI